MDTEVAVEGTATASGPTYVVNVEGIDHDWPSPTITAVTSGIWAGSPPRIR